MKIIGQKVSIDDRLLSKAIKCKGNTGSIQRMSILVLLYENIKRQFHAVL